MRARDLIELLHQFDPETEIPVSFSQPTAPAALPLPQVVSCQGGDCFRHIVEQAWEGLVVTDAQDRLIYANPRLLEVTGYTVDELIGREVSSFVAEEQQPFYRHQLAERRHGHSTRYVLRVRLADGQLRALHVSATPIPSQHGDYRGSISVITDLNPADEATSPQPALDSKLERLPVQLYELKTRRDQLQQELNLLRRQPAKAATPYWHQGRYLYLIHSQREGGNRVREYVGRDPDKVAQALAAVRCHQQQEALEQELTGIEEQIRNASFKLDSLLWSLAGLPPETPRLHS